MLKTIMLDQYFSSVTDCLASSRPSVHSLVLQTEQSQNNNKSTNKHIHYIYTPKEGRGEIEEWKLDKIVYNFKSKS